MTKTINIIHRERSANRVIQYLFALAVQKQVPGSVIRGHDLDIFGLRDEDAAPIDRSRHLLVRADNDLNVGRIAYLLNSDLIDTVSLQGFMQRLEYFPPPGEVRALLGDSLRPPADPTGERALTIHIRGDDVLRAGNLDYFPLPIAFYEQIVRKSGLEPVFVGQLDGSPYCRELRRRFPDATFRSGSDPLADFNMLAHATNLVCSIGTFSWLAAWLSPVAERIHLPVAGLLNPVQRPDVDLLPHDDDRYSFHLFPLMRWRATARQYDWVLGGECIVPELDRPAVVTLKKKALVVGEIARGIRPPPRRTTLRMRLSAARRLYRDWTRGTDSAELESVLGAAE